MKKILFVIPEFGHGGTNRSLLNLLGVINPEKYDVSIFAMKQEGPYRELFRPWRLLPENDMLAVYYSYPEAMAHASWPGKLKRTAIKARMRLVLKSDTKAIFAAAARELSREHWDLVVAFQESYATLFASFIQADRHIGWIHCDYARYLDLFHRDERETYRKYDRIVTVSDYTAETFRRGLPEAADKAVGIHNLMDTKTIRAQSLAEIQDPRWEKAPFTLISIGRMDPVKRFSEIPAMAAYLKQQKIPFRWYIIGDGGEEKQRVQQAITDNGVEAEVILLGEKDNPYPYIRQSSVLVCPSSSEACPNVVNEGLILRTPVAAADFPTAKELIIPGETGLICPLEKMASALAELYGNPAMYAQLKAGLQNFEYDNRAILAAIENLFDGEMS